MRELVLLSIAVAWSGLQCGTMWIVKTSFLPMLNSRSAEDYAETCQAINMRVFHPTALTGGIILTLLGGYLTTQVDDTGARIACIIATAAMLALALISELGTFPIWKKIQTWTVATQPTDWQTIRQRWDTFHTARTTAAAIAWIAFTTAIITEFR